MLRSIIYFHVFFGMIFLFIIPPIGTAMLLVAGVLILIAVTSGFGARIHRGLDIASVGNHIISK